MSVAKRNVHGNSPRRKGFRHVMRQLSAKLTGRDSCNARRGRFYATSAAASSVVDPWR